MKCKCGKEFKVFPSRIGRKKYCSKGCMYEYRTRPSGLTYNIVAENRAWFKQGRFESKGEASPYWKGDDITYQELHRWIRRNKTMPDNCEHCGQSGQYLEWANKSHEYKRDLEDWLALCKPCHGVHDSGEGRGHAIRIYGKRGLRGMKEKSHD
jgi:hypothetical protein